MYWNDNPFTFVSIHTRSHSLLTISESSVLYNPVAVQIKNGPISIKT